MVRLPLLSEADAATADHCRALGKDGFRVRPWHRDGGGKAYGDLQTGASRGRSQAKAKRFNPGVPSRLRRDDVRRRSPWRGGARYPVRQERPPVSGTPVNAAIRRERERSLDYLKKTWTDLMPSLLVGKIVETGASELQDILTVRGRVYTFLNPVSYLAAMDCPELFSRFDGIFADGSVLVAAVRMLYGKRVVRRSFDMTSLAPEVFAFAESRGESVCIVASRQGQVERAVAALGRRWPRLRFAGCRNGYFSSEEEMDEEAERIASLRPGFLIVGMGTPAQEAFLLKAREAGFGGIGFTCGGFIHQTAGGAADYYPAWADRLNLRFLYRMCRERHTRKRYLRAAALFPARFIRERLSG